ncbi:TPA: hypothetical protein N0F65_000713 [Lagenidium giganteum]|uniref:Protein kinase domain-containing protein n=1 Tax=Lagenidium giganteum TaxID=4803 RepID=A0AAV2ZHG0_9STRA|nr:TPA: hypothetical protein N0F65_000713 [Lagenidium giganteum]
MNVLLTKGLRAKVTDFGLSRSMSHQTTMTAEVGTLAWIAPEVLSGERYTEKADIYSFGVILSEIDTLRQPYVQHTTEKSSSGRLSGANTGSSSMNNVHIALMVCSGQLRPDFSPLCPRVVRELADRCLEQDPTDRPSALEALTALQRLH